MISPKDPIFRFVREKMKLLAAEKKVVDIGTSQRFAKEMRYFRSYFGTNYYALGYKPDMIYGKDNCDYDGDIHKLPFKNNSLGGIICLEVFEHISDPFKAASELHRVLKKNGKALVSAPFLTSYHGKSGKSGKHTEYPDYFRYTHQGLRLLFKKFKVIEVRPVGGPIDFVLHTLFLRKYLKAIPFLYKFILSFDKPKLGRATTRHFVYLEK